MGDSFICLDLETANINYTSICQIGLVEFNEGQETGSWSTLVNPNSHFDEFNSGIHGIRAEDVLDSPSFRDIFNTISSKLKSRIVVHHGHFDRTSFKRCYEHFDLEPIDCDWIDNTKIVRRTWPQFSQRGYGLANLAREFGISFVHHSALHDARTAGMVTNKAILESGESISNWLKLIELPIMYVDHQFQKRKKSVSRTGDESGPLYGESVAFTGALKIQRDEAADIAQKLGFNVTSGVTNKTTFLIVGIQDETRLAGHKKSSKHRKAEDLVQKGNRIEILSENDFWFLVREHSQS